MAMGKLKFKVIGIVFTVLSFIYIGYTIYQIDLDLSLIPLNLNSLFVTGISVIILSITIFLFAYGWVMVVRYISTVPVASFRFMLIYCKTNLGKYLPGNVMHFAARNVVVNKLGWSHPKVLFSTVLEVFFNLISIAILVIIFKREQLFELLQQQTLEVKTYHWVVALSILVGTTILLIFFRKKLIPKLEFFLQRVDKKFAFLFLKEFLLYMLIYTLSGSILVFLLGTVFDVPIDLKVSTDIVLYYALSWLAGYVVIGSPGGIGVREAVLLLLLSQQQLASKEIILTAVLLHRILYIAAEVIAFGISVLSERNSRFNIRK